MTNISALARAHNKLPHTIYSRLKIGMTLQEALRLPFVACGWMDLTSLHWHERTKKGPVSSSLVCEPACCCKKRCVFQFIACGWMDLTLPR